jgi:hypothetical protein
VKLESGRFDIRIRSQHIGIAMMGGVPDVRPEIVGVARQKRVEILTERKPKASMPDDGAVASVMSKKARLDHRDSAADP